jgi:UDP-N-acetylglucosamine 2-epimerase (non-hydrolysing)
MARVFLVVGTRPEAIKLAPVALALRAAGHAPILCATGQHPVLATEALGWFGLAADLTLAADPSSLDRLAATLVGAIGEALRTMRPDWVIVQGDTASALAGALAGHLSRMPVAHVEAGLRSGDPASPWPEESFRKLIAAISNLNFAPTEAAAVALRRENVDPGTVHVTGNTGIDALRLVRARAPARPARRPGARRALLVTCHRRESFGAGMAGIAAALARLAARGDVSITVPLHPNPQAGGVLATALSQQPAIRLVPPLPYPELVGQLAAADLVLTDSGGIQEEAPALGVPVLVLRDTTERPEGLAAGTARVVGTDPDRIVAEACRLLDDPAAHAAMARAHSPYGDGFAAQRIVEILSARA